MPKMLLLIIVIGFPLLVILAVNLREESNEISLEEKRLRDGLDFYCDDDEVLHQRQHDLSRIMFVAKDPTIEIDRFFIGVCLNDGEPDPRSALKTAGENLEALVRLKANEGMNAREFDDLFKESVVQIRQDFEKDYEEEKVQGAWAIRPLSSTR